MQRHIGRDPFSVLRELILLRAPNQVPRLFVGDDVRTILQQSSWLEEVHRHGLVEGESS